MCSTAFYPLDLKLLRKLNGKSLCYVDKTETMHLKWCR